jgi:hypothetical protein
MRWERSHTPEEAVTIDEEKNVKRRIRRDVAVKIIATTTPADGNISDQIRKK